MKQKPAVEMSRPLLVERVPRKGSHEHVVAEQAECEALAKRFNIPQLHALSARLLCVPWRGGGLKITGTVEADMTRESIVSLQPFRVTTQYRVERFFLPESSSDENIEDDADPIINGEVDLGEITAETLGLEMDPYPRLADEAFVPPTNSL